MSESYSPYSVEPLEPVEIFVPCLPRRRYWLHALLLLATFLTTLVVGARLQYNFANNLPAFASDADFFPLTWALQQPHRLLLGLPFSLTLMGILLAHELGHFVLCVRNRVYATLPYFIPAPTLIGTMGAFIRIRSPIPSRRALFDIGIAGPIAGFLVAIPVLLVSLALSKPLTTGSADTFLQVGYPLIFQAAHALLAYVGVPASKLPLSAMYLHPTAIAAWVGMFATALNLLPGGQLDGGHILYALFPAVHRTISRWTILLLIPLGLLLWPGWLLWAVLLKLSGTRHPPVAPWPHLDRKRQWLAIAALLMLVLTFLPNPFPGFGLHDLLR